MIHEVPIDINGKTTAELSEPDIDNWCVVLTTGLWYGTPVVTGQSVQTPPYVVEIERLRAALVEERALRYHMTRDLDYRGEGRASAEDRADALASLRFDGVLPPDHATPPVSYAGMPRRLT